MRRVGWGIACLKQDAELKAACHGSAPGRQTVPRTELTALVVLAENINTAVVYEVRVDAQYLTSIGKPARAKRGINGDMWLRFFEACDSKPQCIIRVTRVWRSHFAAKELEIGCSTLFDMRGNTFADEMADRAATRVEVLPSQANAIQATDGMACGRLGCESSRQTWRHSLPSPSVSSYHRIHQPTGKRDSRKEIICLKL